jgi:hypothetical protein
VNERNPWDAVRPEQRRRRKEFELDTFGEELVLPEKVYALDDAAAGIRRALVLAFESLHALRQAAEAGVLIPVEHERTAKFLADVPRLAGELQDLVTRFGRK